MGSVRRFDGALDAPIEVDELGGVYAWGGGDELHVWTSTYPSGVAAMEIHPCGDWTSASVGGTALVGIADSDYEGASPSVWSGGFAGGCDELLRLYCFEQ